MLLQNLYYKNPHTLLILWWSFTKVEHKLVHKHTSKHAHIVFSILLWFPCILGKLAARLHAQSDQLFKLPWALWVFPGFIRSSCWKFGTMKNMMHGERDKYHRDSSAMCHLMQSMEREKCDIRFSKQRTGWCLCFSNNSTLIALAWILVQHRQHIEHGASFFVCVLSHFITQLSFNFLNASPFFFSSKLKLYQKSNCLSCCLSFDKFYWVCRTVVGSASLWWSSSVLLSSCLKWLCECPCMCVHTGMGEAISWANHNYVALPTDGVKFGKLSSHFYCVWKRKCHDSKLPEICCF